MPIRITFPDHEDILTECSPSWRGVCHGTRARSKSIPRSRHAAIRRRKAACPRLFRHQIIPSSARACLLALAEDAKPQQMYGISEYVDRRLVPGGYREVVVQPRPTEYAGRLVAPTTEGGRGTVNLSQAGGTGSVTCRPVTEHVVVADGIGHRRAPSARRLQP